MSVIPATTFRTVLALGIFCFSALTLILCNVLLYRMVKGKDREKLPGFTNASVLVLSQLIILIGVASNNWWFMLVGFACVLTLVVFLITKKRVR